METKGSAECPKPVEEVEAAEEVAGEDVFNAAAEVAEADAGIAAAGTTTPSVHITPFTTLVSATPPVSLLLQNGNPCRETDVPTSLECADRHPKVVGDAATMGKVVVDVASQKLTRIGPVTQVAVPTQAVEPDVAAAHRMVQVSEEEPIDSYVMSGVKSVSW